jgi:CheY-like chemotaxis protein
MNARLVILCLDDQATALELEIRKRVLEIAGYRVMTATTGDDALELFRKNRVDLVLTEEIQPVFTLAAIKVLKPEVTIAIYSAHWEASAEHMRFADVWMSKLVSANEFLRAIENLLVKTPPAAAA